MRYYFIIKLLMKLCVKLVEKCMICFNIFGIFINSLIIKHILHNVYADSHKMMKSKKNIQILK